MDSLIEENMGLIVSIVNRFKPKNNAEREDFVQAGRIGLWKAIKKYDASRGIALSTYAWNPIKWEIIKEIKSTKRDRYCPMSKTKVPSYVLSERLWECLPSTLSEEEITLLNLRGMGYRLSEMSEIVEKKTSYVKRIFYNAIRKIREINAQ